MRAEFRQRADTTGVLLGITSAFASTPLKTQLPVPPSRGLPDAPMKHAHRLSPDHQCEPACPTQSHSTQVGAAALATKARACLGENCVHIGMPSTEAREDRGRVADSPALDGTQHRGILQLSCGACSTRLWSGDHDVSGGFLPRVCCEKMLAGRSKGRRPKRVDRTQYCCEFVA